MNFNFFGKGLILYFKYPFDTRNRSTMELPMILTRYTIIQSLRERLMMAKGSKHKHITVDTNRNVDEIVDLFLFTF
jgi:hypothetical protein